MRIAVGGFQHETNTFAPMPATLADFQAPDAWPGLTRGEELFEAVAGINLPVTGFVAEATRAGHRLLPLTWCSATPSARVTREAFEHVSRLLLEDLERHRNVDAVYLDLHGAMVAEHIDDADGELLARVRSLVGNDVPVFASLDFHANVSRRMIDAASALVAYRTYPHVDMAETGARTYACLQQLMDLPRPLRAWRSLPFLIPLTSQCTLIEPLASIMDTVAAQERAGVTTAGFTPGFPAADVAKCGPSVFAYGRESAAVAGCVEELCEQIAARENEFALDIHSIESALLEISRSAGAGHGPIVLADTQDNPGGGGNADTTSLIKALIERRVKHVLAGVLWDPDVATLAHGHGRGASFEAALGARSGFGEETPLRARFEVESLGDGRFSGTGPFYRGARMDLGPMALLRTGGISIAIASRKQQAADQAMFRHLGVEPASFDVLVLKSSVHFRADFGPIARRVLVVEAPGPNVADPAKLPFRHLRPGMRLRPDRS